MANILHFLKKVLLADLKSGHKPDYYLVAAILLIVAIPAGYAVSNIALALFAIAAIAGIKKTQVKYSTALLLPVMLFGLMCASLAWSINLPQSLKALSKNLPLLLIPVCVILNPISGAQLKVLLKYYSWAMVGYAAYYVLRAIARYTLLGNSNVFFYHELTTKDVNAVHVSLYMALALFYIITSGVKSIWRYIAITLISLVILLLSSKSLIIITFLLSAVYMMFFSQYSRMFKIKAALAGIILLAGIAVAVPKVRERFTIELITAFNQNTTSTLNGNENARVRNVSLAQAWNDDSFRQEQYFPGTAFRLFQTRIFLEMATEDKVWLSGYGINAVQPKIKEKVEKYNLYHGYGEFNFHNQYIQNLAELGIGGLLLLTIMVLINLKNAVYRKDFIHISLAILLITLFLTESLLARQRGIIFFAAFYCFFNAQKGYNKHINTI